jgi:acyl-CoA thioesterase FadM
LHFPDEVLVGSKVARIGGSSADIGHVVVSRRQQQIVADGISVIVIFDYAAGRPVRIPADLRGQLSRHLTHSDSATEASASDG